MTAPIRHLIKSRDGARAFSLTLCGIRLSDEAQARTIGRRCDRCKSCERADQARRRCKRRNEPVAREALEQEEN